jgi:hypothetical protein
MWYQSTLTVMTGNSRPFRDSHDRPLYSKQFCDMEFICVPEPDGQDKALAEVAIKKRNRSISKLRFKMHCSSAGQPFITLLWFTF